MLHVKWCWWWRNRSMVDTWYSSWTNHRRFSHKIFFIYQFDAGAVNVRLWDAQNPSIHPEFNSIGAFTRRLITALRAPAAAFCPCLMYVFTSTKISSTTIVSTANRWWQKNQAVVFILVTLTSPYHMCTLGVYTRRVHNIYIVEVVLPSRHSCSVWCTLMLMLAVAYIARRSAGTGSTYGTKSFPPLSPLFHHPSSWLARPIVPPAFHFVVWCSCARERGKFYPLWFVPLHAIRPVKPWTLDDDPESIIDSRQWPLKIAWAYKNHVVSWRNALYFFLPKHSRFYRRNATSHIIENWLHTVLPHFRNVARFTDFIAE